ncbi:glucose-6-phosphate dehydrogenase [Microbacterium sp. Root61]|uniref:hypothetical protein n=1 Tax=Microbacterium sp. Root61 TaxID=1736570 RepID=UPI0006FDE2F3|nr:hypothetical protein [Microbacterium sp. Root61]KRA23815.1 glucose-6-phosphate dehydrogenase [Microbacterium sp. Root61]
MKVVASSDWRDAIEFDTPMPVAEIAPGDPARCTGCGSESDALPRTELWAVKHRHPNDHGGFVRFYCAEHVPVFEAPVVPVEVQRAAPAKKKEPRAAPMRKPTPIADRPPRAMCPDCYVEVSATGVCGMCGRTL